MLWKTALPSCGKLFYFLKINVSRDTGAPFIAAGHPEDVDTRPPGPLDQTLTNKSSSFVFGISLFSLLGFSLFKQNCFSLNSAKFLCFSPRAHREWRCSTCWFESESWQVQYRRHLEEFLLDDGLDSCRSSVLDFTFRGAALIYCIN